MAIFVKTVTSCKKYILDIKILEKSESYRIVINYINYYNNDSLLFQLHFNLNFWNGHNRIDI